MVSNAEVVAKPLTFVISALTSFILVLRIVLVAKLVISGILSLTTLFFTTLLSLLKSTVTDANLSINSLSSLLFKLLKLVGKRFNLSTFIYIYLLIFIYLIYLL